MEMQIFELNRLASQKFEMTDLLENVTIEVIKICTCEEFCEIHHSVELCFAMRKLYDLQNSL